MSQLLDLLALSGGLVALYVFHSKVGRYWVMHPDDRWIDHLRRCHYCSSNVAAEGRWWLWPQRLCPVGQRLWEKAARR